MILLCVGVQTAVKSSPQFRACACACAGACACAQRMPTVLAVSGLDVRPPHFKRVAVLVRCQRTQWSHLTEKMAYERLVREKRLRASLSQAKKETEFVRKKVGQARRIEYANHKRSGAGDGGGGGGSGSAPHRPKTMAFKQRPVQGSLSSASSSSTSTKKKKKKRRTDDDRDSD